MPVTQFATSKFIPSLDGIRAVAVLLVLLGHAHVPGVPAAAGVTIFFFLSGYLITTLLRVEADKNHGRIHLRDFYLRRALRILPPLYITLTAVLILNATGVIPDEFDLGGTLAAALHLGNYWQAAGLTTLPRGSGVFWSVAVEEHFYLLFPILYIGLLRWTDDRARQALVLVVLCAAAVFWRFGLVHVFHVRHEWISYATDARADSLLWGCALAIAANPFLDKPILSRQVATWAAVPVVILGVLVAPHVAPWPTVYTFQAITLGFFFVAVVGHPDTWAARLLNWRPVAYIGVLSYGIYLVHRLVQIPLQESANLSWPIVTALSLVGSIAVASLMHIGIERPATRIRKRLAHTGSPAAPSVGGKLTSSSHRD